MLKSTNRFVLNGYIFRMDCNQQHSTTHIYHCLTYFRHFASSESINNKYEEKTILSKPIATNYWKSVRENKIENTNETKLNEKTSTTTTTVNHWNKNKKIKNKSNKNVIYLNICIQCMLSLLVYAMFIL